MGHSLKRQSRSETNKQKIVTEDVHIYTQPREKLSPSISLKHYKLYVNISDKLQSPFTNLSFDG